MALTAIQKDVTIHTNINTHTHTPLPHPLLILCDGRVNKKLSERKDLGSLLLGFMNGHGVPSQHCQRSSWSLETGKVKGVGRGNDNNNKDDSNSHRILPADT